LGDFRKQFVILGLNVVESQRCSQALKNASGRHSGRATVVRWSHVREVAVGNTTIRAKWKASQCLHDVFKSRRASIGFEYIVTDLKIRRSKQCQLVSCSPGSSERQAESRIYLLYRPYARKSGVRGQYLSRLHQSRSLQVPFPRSNPSRCITTGAIWCSWTLIQSTDSPTNLSGHPCTYAD
jgi:hypothetical protein